MQGTTPVYNLLPDILSNLSSESSLSQRAFQEIMRHLLQYIGKEKHADSLVDKLCARFVTTSDITQWRNLTFCIGQVNFAEPLKTESKEFGPQISYHEFPWKMCHVLHNASSSIELYVRLPIIDIWHLKTIFNRLQGQIVSMPNDQMASCSSIACKTKIVWLPVVYLISTTLVSQQNHRAIRTCLR